MATDRIEDVRSLANTSHAELVFTVQRGRGGRFVLPVELAAAPILKAEVNHGRWIVRCPYCAGAELADHADPRFFCLSCYNVGSGGKWLPVQFPGDGRAIEGELLKRPEANRNWLPHESVEDLRRENAERS